MLGASQPPPPLPPPPPPLPDGFDYSYDVAGCSNPAHCGTFVAVPATMCDGVPTYQARGPGGPVLFRQTMSGFERSSWAVCPQSIQGTDWECVYDGRWCYLLSNSSPARTSGAPSAPVYSAGHGWIDVENNLAQGSITVTPGGGSAIGGGGGH